MMELLVRIAMLNLLFAHAVPAFAAGLCFDAFDRDAQVAFEELNHLSERTYTARAIETAGVGAGLAIAKYAKSPVGGAVMGGLVLAYMEGSNYLTNQRRARLEGAETLVRAYQEFRLTGDTDSDATQALMRDARVQKQNEREVMSELVRRMNSGALCEDGVEPKPLGKIISDLREYESESLKALR